MQAQIPEQAAADQLFAKLVGLHQLRSQRLPVQLDQGSQQGFKAFVLTLEQGLLLAPLARPGTRSRHHSGAEGGSDHRHSAHGPDPLYNGIVMHVIRGLAKHHRDAGTTH
jgi:hypothetical protein